MASAPDSGIATSGTISRTLREAPKLQRLFNLGLRTLCFAPMWDPVRERWYAAALTWSKSPRHGFSRTNELSYLNAFCDVTMAEILRIEARQEAKSKAALMSSVSHELRSPLRSSSPIPLRNARLLIIDAQMVYLEASIFSKERQPWTGRSSNKFRSAVSILSM
jgi:signal transduction histidine kinase